MNNMNFMDKLEKTFGRFAIQNISLVLLICYGFGYAIEMVNPEFLYFLTLEPYMILHGQIWRLFTWVIVPPAGFDFFTLIMLYFYFSIGTTLERTWGTFRYNLFLFSGMFFTVIGSFITLALGYLGCGPYFSTYYVNLSIFLAFAMTFPESSVLLFFIIPIRMKILGVIYALLVGYQFVISNAVGKIAIGASLLNVIVFFFLTKNLTHLRPKQIKRRMDYKRQTSNVTPITRHKCAICGRTERDGDLTFRFCSKCNGNYEYCQNHLYTHEHVK